MSAAPKLRSINPATGKTLGEVPVSTPAQIKDAVAAARRAQPGWRALGASGRVAALQKHYDDFAAHSEDLARLTAEEMGRPIEDNRKVIQSRLAGMRWNLDNAIALLAPETTFVDARQIHQMHYEPYGVYGVIAPWNVPFSNFIMTALQPLLAGNTVVYKLSEDVPLFGKALDEAFARAGLPPGVFNQIYGAGDVGEMLARAGVDHLHFTGSTAVGKKLYQIAAEKFIPITLELGGSDAGLVFEDAAIDHMIPAIFRAKFANAGQICCSLKRLLVHEGRYDELVKKLIAYIRTQKVGDPLDPETAIGPLASDRQKRLLIAQLNDARGKGAKILLDDANAVPPEGAYFGPVLLTGVTLAMRAGNEELFGPVLPIATFKTEEEAIALANATPYGLAAFVYTEDRVRYRRVAAQLQAGSVAHNGVDFFQGFNPFGGYKNSGLGRSGGRVGLQACCQVKVVTMEKE